LIIVFHCNSKIEITVNSRLLIAKYSSFKRSIITQTLYSATNYGWIG